MRIYVLRPETTGIRPERMLDSGVPEGTVFQMYDNEFPSDTYYITCGPYEKRVVEFWYNEEESKFRLSTSTLSELEEFMPHISVRENSHIGFKIEQ